MPLPVLTNPTGRNTNAHIFTDGNENEFFFSYETCIAYRGAIQCSALHNDKMNVAVRLENWWGPTTGRHFKDLGCADFEVVTMEKFHELVADSDD